MLLLILSLRDGCGCSFRCGDCRIFGFFFSSSINALEHGCLKVYVSNLIFRRACTKLLSDFQVLNSLMTNVADPVSWPCSPWRLLQVSWDEPDLLHNVKHVSPWLVESVSNMPIINLSSFSPPRKNFNGQFPISSLLGNPLGPSNPLCYLTDNAPPDIHGARHAQIGISLSNLQLNNKLQAGLFPSGNSCQNLEKSESVKKHQFLLFGQPILTEQQIICSCPTDIVSQASSLKRPVDVHPDNKGIYAAEFGLDTGHCKAFMESKDVGHTLDLTALGSYEELYKKLANMFGIERSEILNHVQYNDAAGTVKRTGDEPFGDFMKITKRLTILSYSSSKNIGRTWITRMRSAKNGLGASNKTGPLSIFA
ncbi:hypothetical protein UlMin_030743 [Ulmus minor]